MLELPVELLPRCVNNLDSAIELGATCKWMRDNLRVEFPLNWPKHRITASATRTSYNCIVGFSGHYSVDYAMRLAYLRVIDYARNVFVPVMEVDWCEKYIAGGPRDASDKFAIVLLTPGGLMFHERGSISHCIGVAKLAYSSGTLYKEIHPRELFMLPQGVMKTFHTRGGIGCARGAVIAVLACVGIVLLKKMNSRFFYHLMASCGIVTAIVAACVFLCAGICMVISGQYVKPVIPCGNWGVTTDYLGLKYYNSGYGFSCADDPCYCVMMEFSQKCLGPPSNGEPVNVVIIAGAIVAALSAIVMIVAVGTIIAGGRVAV